MSPNKKLVLEEAVIAVIGVLGSDAGYVVLTPHGLVHVGGNNPVINLASIAAHAGMLSDTRMKATIGEIVGPALRAAVAREIGAEAG